MRKNNKEGSRYSRRLDDRRRSRLGAQSGGVDGADFRPCRAEDRLSYSSDRRDT